MAKFIVAPGFVVGGKTEGQEVKKSDVDRLDIMIESGRVVVKAAESSSTMKSQPDVSGSEEE
jgi:hypothetical protein